MKDWIEALDAETRVLPEPAPVRVVRNGNAIGSETEDGTPVVLDAVNVMGRADYARTVQYTWRLIATPDGSEAEMAYSTFVRSRFMPDVAGQYLVHLEAATDRGMREYVTRVTVHGAGDATIYPAYSVHTERAGSTTPQSSDAREQIAMKTFALSADGARRSSRDRRRKPLLGRIRQALHTDITNGPAYGEPVSSF